MELKVRSSVPSHIFVTNLCTLSSRISDESRACFLDSVQECNKPEIADRSRYRNLVLLLLLLLLLGLRGGFRFLSWLTFWATLTR